MRHTESRCDIGVKSMTSFNMLFNSSYLLWHVNDLVFVLAVSKLLSL